MQIEMINGNLLVELESREEVTDGGIHIPERSQKSNAWGTVKAVASDCNHPVSSGDRVYVPTVSGTLVHSRTEKKDFVLVHESKLLAVES